MSRLHEAIESLQRQVAERISDDALSHCWLSLERAQAVLAALAEQPAYTNREVMQKALGALDGVEALLTSIDMTYLIVYEEVNNAIAALKAALAEPEQDVELSAALGWPGGISTPILDRHVLLDLVAKQRSAALAEQCQCGDRPAAECPGEWGPGCDLGANEAHVKVHEPQEPGAPFLCRMGEQEFLLHYIDGRYSFCTDEKGFVHHPVPQRQPLPKHDQHCVDVPGYGLMATKLVRAVERAHGIGGKE